MSDAAKADAWRHNFWIERMREVVACIRDDARELRKGSDAPPDGTLRVEIIARADECDRIARMLDDEITRQENWT